MAAIFQMKMSNKFVFKLLYSNWNKTSLNMFLGVLRQINISSGYGLLLERNLFKEMLLKLSSVKQQPFFSGFTVLKVNNPVELSSSPTNIRITVPLTHTQRAAASSRVGHVRTLSSDTMP